VDTFAKDRLPPKDQWPRLHFDLPELRYPDRLNCATVLLDDAIAEGHGDRPAILTDGGAITYRELLARANRIANALAAAGVVPGNRVLLRGYNGPELYAAWLAVMKTGAIAVTTMPMLRSPTTDSSRSCRRSRRTAASARSSPGATATWRPGWRRPPTASGTRTPRPTTYACSRSRRARPASRRPACTSTATCSRWRTWSPVTS
jgi:acyl-CoA synthetase (AMP-forming)/AMP-acid ligase II